jgi:hypothetical protein
MQDGQSIVRVRRTLAQRLGFVEPAFPIFSDPAMPNWINNEQLLRISFAGRLRVLISGRVRVREVILSDNDFKNVASKGQFGVVAPEVPWFPILMFGPLVGALLLLLIAWLRGPSP